MLYVTYADPGGQATFSGGHKITVLILPQSVKTVECEILYFQLKWNSVIIYCIISSPFK